MVRTDARFEIFADHLLERVDVRLDTFEALVQGNLSALEEQIYKRMGTDI